MKLKKAMLALVCALALVVGSVMGTMAYLTSEDSVKNTFTVGDVQIKLDEAPVDENGKETTGDRVKANKYKLMPGHEYDKDPTVTVLEGSDDAYVRMLVSVSDMAKLKEAFPVTKYPTFYNGDVFLLQMLVKGWDNNTWEFKKVNTDGSYEFWYNGIAVAEQELPALFTQVVIPGTVNNTELAKLQNIEINVVAHAIQEAGFADAAEAWDNF